MSSEQGDIWCSSNYFIGLQKEHQAKYKRKLTLTNGQLLPDPYGIAENWKNDVKLMPDVSWGDMYNYLINSPSEYTHDNLRAYKSLEDLNFFVCNRIQDIYYDENTKESEFCSIKTKVQKYLFKHVYYKFILVFLKRETVFRL